MSIQASHGTLHIGRTDQLNGFAIEQVDFIRIGNGLLTPNRELAMKGFPYAAQFFSGEPVQLETLDAFLLMEELDILLHIRGGMPQHEQDQLMMIYNNVKYQVYNEQRATVSL